MDKLIPSVLTDIIWETIKKGFKVTKNFLREKLSNWIINDETIDIIANKINSVPQEYLISKGMLNEYFKVDEDFVNLLNSLKSTGNKYTAKQDNIKNTGILLNGYYERNKIEINQFNADKSKPKDTHNKEYNIMDKFTKYSPIQIVKSFSHTRDNCDVIKTNDTCSISKDIYIPNNVKERRECTFLMVLFAFSPYENWENYAKENYSLYFDLKVSNTINKVQLQIKDKNQKQFIDFPLTSGRFKQNLTEMAPIKSWSSVRELCFTIFADDKYITDENGHIEISNLSLIN